jgi:hypothetical protein
MKILKYLFIAGALLLIAPVFAQTPQQIEADLLKSIKKIDPAFEDNTNANDLFAKKLYNYIANNPATLGYPFAALIRQHVDIHTSDDSLLRIYSWDTWTGGTAHFFESVFQYQDGGKIYAILDTPREEGDIRPWYNKLYTLKTAGNTYYLAVNTSIGSTKDMGGSIQIMDIENGKLNDSVKLIKTVSGLHSDLSFACDFSKTAGKLTPDTYPSIKYDAVTQTITIPLILANGAATNKQIAYKFNGQYFERVKN